MAMKTTQYWEVTSALKSCEKDDYEAGCLPESYQEWTLPHLIGTQAPTLPELMEKVWANIPIRKKDDDAIQYDACEEPGRIDIQGIEDADANEATEAQIAKFKQGDLPLFAVTYHMYVAYITRETIALTELPGTCPTCTSTLTPPMEINTGGALPPNYCEACDRQIDEEEVIRPWQGTPPPEPVRCTEMLIPDEPLERNVPCALPQGHPGPHQDHPHLPKRRWT